MITGVMATYLSSKYSIALNIVAVSVQNADRIYKRYLKTEDEFRVFRIGDCPEPRDISNAVHEGSFIARQI